MMENELPEGWIECNLGDVISLEYGKSLPAPERSGIGFPVMGSNGEVGRHTEFLVDGPGIIVGRKGSHGEVVWVEENFFPIDTTYYVKTTPSITIKYAFNLLKSLDLKSLNRSTAIPGLNRTDAYELPISLPPLPEQTRIVAKLDAAFGHLETLKTSLARIPELLKKFRQTVLTQAVTGKLTEEWRKNKDLPEWTSSKLSSVSKRITVGFVGKMSNEYKESGIPFLRSQNVRAFKFSPKNLLFVSPEFHEKIKKSALFPGDVVVVRSGYPGTTCVIPEDFQEANCSDILILTPQKELLNAYYVSVFMNSDFGKSLVFQGKVGNAQQHFNTKALQNTRIPLPLVEEQQKIVNRVEALFAQADALEAQYRSLKAKIDQLPQALLAKAFRGELVPQDPADEPASVLLDKIKAATDAVGKKSRKTGQTALAFMEE